MIGYATRWIPDCGTHPVDVAVHGPVVYALRPPCEAARRVAVAFENDRGGPDGDRNLYASLVTAPGEPLPPPSPDSFERSAFTDGTIPVQRQGERGFALYWTGELVSRPISSPVTLLADVDAPGDEGALVSVSWDPPCGVPLELRVTGPTAIPLDPPACGGRDPAAVRRRAASGASASRSRTTPPDPTATGTCTSSCADGD